MCVCGRYSGQMSNSRGWLRIEAQIPSPAKDKSWWRPVWGKMTKKNDVKKSEVLKQILVPSSLMIFLVHLDPSLSLTGKSRPPSFQSFTGSCSSKNNWLKTICVPQSPFWFCSCFAFRGHVCSLGRFPG